MTVLGADSRLWSLITFVRKESGIRQLWENQTPAQERVAYGA